MALTQGQKDFLSSFGVSAGSSAIGGAFGLIGQALGNKYAKEQMELQNKLNVDMWNMQNDYNKPSAQVQRLIDAGLSPNLAYGSVSSGNASSAPAAYAPERKIDLSAFGDMMQGFLGNIAALKALRLQDKKIQEQDAKNQLLDLQVNDELSRMRGRMAIYDPDMLTRVEHTRGGWFNSVLNNYYRDMYQYDLGNKQYTAENRFADFKTKQYKYENILPMVAIKSQHDANLALWRARIAENQNDLLQFKNERKALSYFLDYTLKGLNSVGNLVGKFMKPNVFKKTYNKIY